jgi:hypothetical protein
MWDVYFDILSERRNRIAAEIPTVKIGTRTKPTGNQLLFGPIIAPGKSNRRQAYGIVTGAAGVCPIASSVA